MKITNKSQMTINTYDIELEVDGETKTYTYKEYMDGRKLTDQEIFDEEGGAVFDSELESKFSDLADAYED
jgi:hypothetical protein